MLSFCRAPPLHLTPSDLDYNPFSRQRQERFMQAFIPRVLALAPLNCALNVLKHCRVSVQIVQVKKQFFSQATGTTVVALQTRQGSKEAAARYASSVDANVAGR